jgi:hypothetical protein
LLTQPLWRATSGPGLERPWTALPHAINRDWGCLIFSHPLDDLAHVSQ